MSRAVLQVPRIGHRHTEPIPVANPRSVTTIRQTDGPPVVCKTSHLPLGQEAYILERESTHSGGRVQAIPFRSYDPARNELVTEYIAGDNLFNVLWNGTSRLSRREQPENLGELVRAVASWISGFHQRSRSYVTVAQPPADGYGKRCVEAALEDKLQRLTALRSGSRRDAELAAGIRRHARSLAGDSGWDHLPVSVVHADCTAGNVLVARDGRVFVLDFADARVGFPLEDVVRFWSSIWEIGQCGQARHSLFEPLLDAILVLNGLPTSITVTAPFTLLRQWNSVTKLLEVESLRGRFGLATMLTLRRIAAVHERWLRRVSASLGD